MVIGSEELFYMSPWKNSQTAASVLALRCQSKCVALECTISKVPLTEDLQTQLRKMILFRVQISYSNTILTGLNHAHSFLFILHADRYLHITETMSLLITGCCKDIRKSIHLFYLHNSKYFGLSGFFYFCICELCLKVLCLGLDEDSVSQN